MYSLFRRRQRWPQCFRLLVWPKQLHCMSQALLFLDCFPQSSSLRIFEILLSMNIPNTHSCILRNDKIHHENHGFQLYSLEASDAVLLEWYCTPDLALRNKILTTFDGLTEKGDLAFNFEDSTTRVATDAVSVAHKIELGIWQSVSDIFCSQ